jgi:hypothetical protein
MQEDAFATICKVRLFTFALIQVISKVDLRTKPRSLNCPSGKWT